MIRWTCSKFTKYWVPPLGHRHVAYKMRSLAYHVINLYRKKDYRYTYRTRDDYKYWQSPGSSLKYKPPPCLVTQSVRATICTGNNILGMSQLKLSVNPASAMATPPSLNKIIKVYRLVRKGTVLHFSYLISRPSLVVGERP